MRSKNIQVIIADAEAIVVAAKAKAAVALAANADPALKPNQPNHNIPVPSNTKAVLEGSWCGLFFFLKPLHLQGQRSLHSYGQQCRPQSLYTKVFVQ